jgi:hypothetical protein
MDPEFIEEDSKSIGKTSTKLFTLSTLTQAFSVSLLGDADPISNPNSAMFRKVAERADFVRLYWRRISEVFGSLWLPTEPDQLMDGEARAAYLAQQRATRHVAFQATFLLALGRVGFQLGEANKWDATAAPWEKLDALRALELRAYRGSDPDGRGADAYDATWARTIMKPRVDRHSGEVDGYVFDHSPDKIRATAQLLWSTIEPSRTVLR